jgi:uncharacterized protein DUF5916/cellulose/xylan binding protein with CBM9 domain
VRWVQAHTCVLCQIAIAISAIVGGAQGQTSDATSAHRVAVPEARAVPRVGDITIDGRLDEPAWSAAPPVTTFYQVQPREGPPATQRTEIRFLYDADALYVGARMYDSLGARGVRTRLARRDDQLDLDNVAPSPITSDKLTITLDPYHDHLTRAVFEINPSGVIGDALGAGGSTLDPSWDPVWQHAAQIDSLGWTAELRIPFSQLRFSRDTAQVWGLQIARLTDRLNERDQWAFYHKNEASGAVRFGHLTGIVVHDRPHQSEILPYALAQDEANGNNHGDPVNAVNQPTARVGADVKYLLTSNLTLDATINPDFGQVELDSAVVNLTAFETFFPEKRPFFVSGAGAFDYGSLNCNFCSNFAALSLFYSRRIGRFPELGDYVVNLGSTQTSFVPPSTQILGAAKITGRTRSGYTIGFLDALTNQENARIQDTLGRVSHAAVEPLSNYLVARVKRDFGQGATVIGGMVTSTVRRLDTDLLRDSLRHDAEAAGTDFITTWDDRNYSLTGNLAFSAVGGGTHAILLTQQSSARYFQRPDRRHTTGGLFDNRYDSTATSLRGYGGYLRLGKDNGDWLWEGIANLRSPGFEVNDLAFEQHASYQQFVANIARQWTVPHSWYRDIYTTAGTERTYNYDGDLTLVQYHGFFMIDWPNYWSTKGFFIHRPTSLDDQLARGGPVFKRRGLNDLLAAVSTDSRRPVVLALSAEGSTGLDEPEHEITPTVNVLIKPSPFASISIAPTLDILRTQQQYDTTIAVAPAAVNAPRVFFGKRYVFASLHETTLSASVRLQWLFSPTLGFSLYAQPLLASAHYYNFREFNRTRQLYTTVDPYVRDAAGNYTVCPTGCGFGRGEESYDIGNPDFNTRSLRANAVLRWEWRRGSTLYLVWQQLRENDTVFGIDGNFALVRDRAALFRSIPDDTFIVKVSYWLGR